MTDTPTPLAAPPITIGPFDNVPAPGSPIRSDWPQEISTVVSDLLTKLSGIHIRNGSAVYTTDASGIAVIAWGGTAFPTFPVFVAMPQDTSLALCLSVYQAEATFGSVRVLRPDGSALSNSSVKLSWIAVQGPLVATLADDEAPP